MSSVQFIATCCSTYKPNESWANRVKVTLGPFQSVNSPLLTKLQPLEITMDIKVVTFNTQGLQGNYKRRKVLHWLKKKKAHVYLLQETHSTKGVEEDWRNQWGADIYYSHGDSDSRGVSIWFNKPFDYHVNNVYRDEYGRYIIMDLNINSIRTIIVNVYAPNGDDVHFFQSLINDINNLECPNIIWGGDFNFVFSLDMDKKGGAPTTHFKCRDYVKDWMLEFDFVDIWRCQHEYGKEYTWFSNRRPKKSKRFYSERNIAPEYEYIACRLDFFLVPFSLQQNISKCNILAGFHSDHSMVSMLVKINPVEKGRGFWKLNCSYLEDLDYIKEMNRTIDRTTEENPGTDDGLMWEQIKCNIRRDSISYGHRVNKKRKDDLASLESDKLNLQKELLENPDGNTREKLDRIEASIEQIISHQSKGAAVRTRSMFYEQGEKSSKFFHSLEKSKNDLKNITCLIDDDGQKVHGITNVLLEEKKFYENVYSSKVCAADINEEVWDKFFFPNSAESKVPDYLIPLEDPLIEKEIQQALREAENNKSPGTDGIPVDFYRVFWHKIKKYMLDSFQHSLSTGITSITQRQGIISLIPKKSKNPLYLHNWRPINVLNHDIKLLTKAMANRIKSSLDFLINSDQTGFIGGRLIGENILNLTSLSDHLSHLNIKGKAIMLDFEKAFDSLEWCTVDAALTYHGFGPNFRSWVRCIQNGAQSCVINAGHFTPFFDISRGVRQGCPLSPYLFILAIEVLANHIRSNHTIKGITVDSHEFKLNLYADDVTLLLEDRETNINNALEVIDQFGSVSGLKLNHAKTESLSMGVKNNPNDTHTVTLLGIKVGNNREHTLFENIAPIVGKIENIIKTWSMRNLSLLGRIYIIKSLCISMLMHPLSVSHHIGKDWVQVLNSILFSYIWKGGVEQVRRAVLRGPFDLGGAEMTDINCLIKTLQLKWIIRLGSPGIAAWKSCVMENLVIPNIRYSFECNLSPKDSHFLLKHNTCQFWVDTIKTWCEVHYQSIIETWDLVIHQPIWLNSLIRQSKKPVFYSNWYHKGVTHLKHLVVESEYRFISWEEFVDTYNIKCTFLQFYSILCAIPREWRRLIKQGPDSRNADNGTDSDILTIDSLATHTHRSIYQRLSKESCDVPIDRFAGWDTDFNLKEFVIDETLWTRSYKRCFEWTQSSELRSFEYRFRLRILPSKKQLVKMGVVDDMSCNRCGNSTEDLKHIFWECEQVSNVWEKVTRWLNIIFSLNLGADPRVLLFGLLDNIELEIPNVFWLCILLTKKLIWVTRCTERSISPKMCLLKIKETEMVEAKIATRNQRIGKHILKWGDLSSLMLFDCQANAVAKEVDTSKLYEFDS